MPWCIVCWILVKSCTLISFNQILGIFNVILMFLRIRTQNWKTYGAERRYYRTLLYPFDCFIFVANLKSSFFILSCKQLICSSTWTKTNYFKSLPWMNFSKIIIDNFPLFDSEKFELSTKCHTLYHLIRKFQLLIFQLTGSLSEGKQAYMALKLHLNIRVWVYWLKHL